MKKMNNKGFSLVELIVVMAIMAILAVTLAPRLSQYIDKARQANDREAVNAVYTAIKLGMLDDTIYATPEAVIDLSTDPDTLYTLNLTDIYTVTGKTWAAGTSTDPFEKQILEVLGSFKLQSSLAKDGRSEIVVTVTSPTLFSVALDYDTNDGTGSAVVPETFDYIVDSSAVAVN